MQYLTLLPEQAVNEPFIIPNLSPVSRPSSRKNSDASVTDLDVLDKTFLLSAANAKNTDLQNTQTERRSSLTLL
ncbi:sporulation protein 24 [Monosporozyma servazzii]